MKGKFPQLLRLELDVFTDEQLEEIADIKKEKDWTWPVMLKHSLLHVLKTKKDFLK